MIYKGITSFRNFLFDQSVLKEFQPEIYSIGIGNLNVGGSGKTPMTDYFISLLQEKKTAVISRGYGRESSGFIELNSMSTATEVGDEPLMLKNKHPEKLFFVSEKRVEGYQQALAKHPDIECFIFDDVFQHRYIKPHLNILLTDCQKPFYKDKILPWGRLREAKKGVSRADLIIVTKVPSDLPDNQKTVIRNEIAAYTNEPIVFAEYLPGDPENQYGEILNPKSEVVLISGLANNQAFYAQQKHNFKIREHFAFKDHYRFTKLKVNEILNQHPECAVITTGKDWVKIKPLVDENDSGKFYISDITVKTDTDLRKYLSF